MRNSPYKFFQRYKAWCYLLPALLILGVFQIYPIIKSFFMGFYTEFDYINGIVYQWGTDNFIKVLEDPDFLLAIKNTCKLVIFAAPLSIGISLLFAVLLNSNILLRKFFQSIYFLPFVTSMVAVSIVWAWMLNKDFGLVNAVLKVFGISKVAWLTDPKMTLGPIPGIIVGALSNIITGLIYSVSDIPFCLVNVAVGLIVGLVAKKWKFGIIPAIITGLALSFICPAIGTPIGIYVYGGLNGTVSDMLVMSLVQGGKSIFQASFLRNVASNLIDKVGTCVIGCLLIKAMPMKFLDNFKKEA